MKHITLKKETLLLLNKARVQFLKKHPESSKLTDDLVITAALETYANQK